jgi:hypothetical protein
MSGPASFRQRIFRPTTNDHEGRSLRLGLCGGAEDAVNAEALFREMIEALLERGQIVGSIDDPRVLALVLPRKLPRRESDADRNAYDYGEDQQDLHWYLQLQINPGL